MCVYYNFPFEEFLTMFCFFPLRALMTLFSAAGGSAEEDYFISEDEKHKRKREQLVGRFPPFWGERHRLRERERERVAQSNLLHLK